MELVLFLGVLIGVPTIVVVGSQFLMFKAMGRRGLMVLCAVVAAICAYFLVEASLAPPIYGNKAAYAGLADGVTLLVLLECLGILLWLAARFYSDWESRIDSGGAIEATQAKGRE